MRRRLTSAAAVALAVLAAAAVLATTRSVAATSVSIGLHDYFITRSVTSAPHGAITFHVKNSGAVTHNFRLRHGTTGTVVFKSANLAPGASITKTFTLKAGTYTIYCSLHPALMHVSFRVT
jgi:plastocyanin